MRSNQANVSSTVGVFSRRSKIKKKKSSKGGGGEFKYLEVNVRFGFKILANGNASYTIRHKALTIT